MKTKTVDTAVTVLWMAVEMLPIVALMLLLWAGHLVVQDVKERSLLTPLEKQELREAEIESTQQCLKNKALEREKLRTIDYLTCA